MKTIPVSYGHEAIVDDEDYDVVSQYSWHVKSYGNGKYPRTSLQKNWVRVELPMHQVIMGVRKGFDMDHINGNPLDNRRCNLRFCTRIENARNSKPKNAHGFKGVSFYSASNRVKPWRARIAIRGKEILIGYFKDIVQAAEAYNEAAKTHFGQFAKLNVIPNKTECLSESATCRINTL